MSHDHPIFLFGSPWNSLRQSLFLMVTSHDIMGSVTNILTLKIFDNHSPFILPMIKPITMSSWKTIMKNDPEKPIIRPILDQMISWFSNLNLAASYGDDSSKILYDSKVRENNQFRWCSNLPILPSGKHTKSYGKWPIEIDGLPIFQMVIFYSYVKLPEGNHH